MTTQKIKASGGSQRYITQNSWTAICFLREQGFPPHCYKKLPLWPSHIPFLLATSTPVTMGSLNLLQTSPYLMTFAYIIPSIEKTLFQVMQSLPFSSFKSSLTCELSEPFHDDLKSEIPSLLPTTLLIVLSSLSLFYLPIKPSIIPYNILVLLFNLLSFSLACKLHECRNCSHSAW